MKTLTHEWEYEGRTITFTWVGDIDVPLTRAYALAFTDEGRLLLVGDFQGESTYWLPGGGIEMGETAEMALHRELMEEAAATITTMKRLGVQRVHDPQKPRPKSGCGSDGPIDPKDDDTELFGPDNNHIEHHGFYWCRISLASEFSPQTEVTERLLVEQTEFLDQLLWGRSDPKAAILLAQASLLDRAYNVNL